LFDVGHGLIFLAIDLKQFSQYFTEQKLLSSHGVCAIFHLWNPRKHFSFVMAWWF